MLTSDIVNGFVGSMLHKKFDRATTTPQCHKEWWDLVCSGDEYIAIAAPRNHAKSTSITFSWLLAALLFREHQFVIIVSDTEAQASLFLGDITNELIENEDLISLFGVKKFIKLSETDIIVQMNDGYKFRVKAKGSEQKLRGMKWAHLRPDLILCDDLENDEINANADRREKFRRWFYGALLPSKSEGGKVVIIGTVLHMDSMLERLMPSATSPNTMDTGIKQYSIKPASMWRAVKYKAHNVDYTKVLWSERFSKEKLQSIRQGYIEQGMPDMYSQEYLNYPIDESTAYFKREDFLPLADEDLKQNLVYYVGMDFAISTKERSDFTAIAVVGVDSRGLMYVVDMRKGRWDAEEIINEMFSVQERYRPELFTVESGIILKAIGPYLNQAMLTRGYINLNPLVPTKDKMTRARSFQARLRAGGVRFDKEASWYQGLEDEMVRFPRDRHDDQVDSLAWIGLTLDKVLEAPTKMEQEEMDWEEEHSEEDTFEGRSWATGY